MAEAHGLADLAQMVELFRRHEALHRQVVLARLQVLAQREHVAVVVAQVPHDLFDLVQRLAQAEHDARLGGDVRVAGLELLDEVQRPLIVRSRARLPVEPRHGLEVVVEDVRRGVFQDLERDVHAPAEVRHQDLDADLRIARACLPDALHEVAGAAVAQVVAVDGGDHHVVEPHRLDGFGQVAGFIRVQRVGPAMGHIAERAAAGADVAHDEEGGGAVTETLAQIGTGGLLTDGVQAHLAQHLLQVLHARAGVRFGADPLRLALHLFGGLDLDGDAGHLLGPAHLHALYDALCLVSHVQS